MLQCGYDVVIRDNSLKNLLNWNEKKLLFPSSQFSNVNLSATNNYIDDEAMGKQEIVLSSKTPDETNGDEFLVPCGILSLPFRF